MALAKIETARLRMRPFVTDDVDEIHRIWLDPGVRRYLWDDEAISRETAASVIDRSIASFEKSGYGLWAVFAHGEDSMIGFCGYCFFHDPPQLELLYGIASPYWGKGFATEAARAMIRCGFEEHLFDRIVASTDAPNLASVRVMEKAGRTFEKRELTNGLDTIYYSILKENFHKDS
jgi:[ribosomal protein S5]-alanine N-acetyltransferase